MNRSARISFRQIDSSRFRLFGLVALALLVALFAAGARSSNASADIFPPLNLQTCAAAPAHATRTLSLQPVVVASNGANYHYYPQGLCNRYLVDLVVPGGHTAEIALGWKSPMLFGGCANLSEDITIYTTSLYSSSFSKLGSAHFQGATATTPYGSSYCTLVQTQGDPVASVHTTPDREIDWIFLLPICRTPGSPRRPGSRLA